MLRDMLLESGGETYGVEWASLRWRAVTDVAAAVPRYPGFSLSAREVPQIPVSMSTGATMSTGEISFVA